MLVILYTFEAMVISFYLKKKMYNLAGYERIPYRTENDRMT